MDAIDNWNDIEPRIRPHVKAIRDAGWKTTSSCEHDMSIDVKGGPLDIINFQKTLRKLGYKEFRVTYEEDTRYPEWAGLRVKLAGELSGTGRPFDLVLLKVEPEAHPLYFVVKTPHYPHSDGEGDEYFYGTHTCPTNWIQNVVAVISQGDEDPHGFASFVRRMPSPESMGEDCADPDEGWATLFPEVVAADNPRSRFV